MNVSLSAIAIVLLTLSGFSCTGDAPLPEPEPEGPETIEAIQLGRVVAFSDFTLSDVVTRDTFETFVRERFHPDWTAHMQGAVHAIFKGDRGNRDDDYVAIYNFDTRDRRNYYYPEEDSPPYPEADAAQEPFAATLAQFADYLSSEREYTDYVLLGDGQLADMPEIRVVGKHHLTIKEGMESAFEDFIINKLHPNYADHVPGMRFFVLKGDRGIDKDGYVGLYTFDSVERRDSYFPVPGGDPSAEYDAAFEPLLPIYEELLSFYEHEDQYMDYTEYTDYVLVQ